VAFHETRFPDDISYGSVGGPGFKTSILEMDSGQETRLPRLEATRHKYDVAYGMKEVADLLAVKEFFLARSGSAHGFRFKDFDDFTTASDHRSAYAYDDVQIGVGDGTETQFQLKKIYTHGGIDYTRLLEKIVSGEYAFGIDGVEQSSGFTVNINTGFVTFSSAVPNTHAVTCGCQFDVPVRFGGDIDTWLGLSRDQYDTGSLPALLLVELKPGTEYPGDYFYGGASYIILNADYTLGLTNGRVIRVDPDASGRKLMLPATTDLELGGPYFFVKNEDGTDSVAIRDNGDTTTVHTLTTGQEVIIMLAKTSGGGKDWLVF